MHVRVVSGVPRGTVLPMEYNTVNLGELQKQFQDEATVSTFGGAESDGSSASQ